MINPFVIKKYAAVIIPQLITLMLFFIGYMIYGLLWALGLMFIGILLGSMIAFYILRNPFTIMLEGRGLLAINMDSTGILHPFIVRVDNPYIRANLKGKSIEDVFDRNGIHSIAVPKKSTTPLKYEKDGGITISLTEKKYNEGRFALFHYPCILYNENLKTILTKDFLSEREKDGFADHGVLYLNRKMEELTSAVRDFGRHVVETLKPKSSILTSKWVMIIVIVLVILIIAMFAPAVWNTIMNTATTAGDGISQATNQAGITPQ